MIITLASRAASLYFVAGMRVTDGPRLAWYERIWRWITKRNYRVAHVNYEAGVVSLERCR